MDRNQFSLQNEISNLLSDFTWDVRGIIHSDGSVNPLPPESRVVTELFQSMIIRRLKKLEKENDVKVEDNFLFGRGYPDINLITNDKKLIALDIKSSRFETGDKISRMTLGTFDGYFLHPNEKKIQKGTKCYNDFSEHWIIAVIYKWKPKENTENMVEIVSTCVGQKWQFAGRVAGSGDTANIGGITSLSRLQNFNTEFKNEKEFEVFWRRYAIEHPRKRTKIPQKPKN